MDPTPTPAPAPAPAKLTDLLNNDAVELGRKYGLVILLAWQFVGGGIKDSIREVVGAVVREELVGLKKDIATLETRIAALERNKP